MTIAYLINQYPKVSHSFIRREIAGLEAAGLTVARFSIRSCEGELVDPEDKQELAKTRFVLSVGAVGLLVNLLLVLLSRPIAAWRAFRLALQVGKRSDRGVLVHLIYLAEASVLLRWFRSAEITHVHAHFGTNPTTVAMLCCALGGPPYSFTVHGPEEFDRAGVIALTEKINRAAFVVAISAFGRSQLYRWCSHTEWQKIHVVHCGVDERFLQAAPVPVPAEPHLVCVGRLCEQKGQLLLLQAAHQMAIAGVPLQLTLVGDGEMRPDVEALIAQYQLGDRVKITGWASGADVQQHLLTARAMVLPSFAEGLPVVIMEALALGRPVISTYVAGIPELVVAGVNGWLVPASSIEPLVQAMREAIELPAAQMAQMGQAGAEAVADQHNSSAEAQKLAALFGYRSIETRPLTLSAKA